MFANPNLESIQIKPLSEVIEYQNEEVLYRFMNHFDIDREESEDIFKETMNWLWLVAIYDFEDMQEHKGKDLPRRRLFINTDILIVDEMWHTFVLYTKDYREFCLNYFGFFIEHGPSKKSEKEEYEKRAIETPEEVIEEVETLLKWRFNVIYEKLGEDTLLKWHTHYPEKYSPEKINSLKKNSF